MNQIAAIPEDIHESHTLVDPEERVSVEVQADFDREDMDLGQDSDSWLPPFMNNEMAAMQAWNWWYGSPKALARAVDHLRSARSPQALSILKRFRRHPGHSLLTYVEAHPRASKLFHDELPEAAFKQTEAASRVFTVLPTLLTDRGEAFRALMQKGTPTEIAHYIEQAWPFMAAVHGAGGYIPPLTPLLISAAMLTQQLSEDGLSTQTRQRLLLTVNMLMRQIPPRLAGILAIHAGVLADAFSHTYKVYGITHKTFDSGRSFWEQASEPAASLAGYLMRSCKPSPSAYGSAFDELKYLERQIVQARCLPRRIVSLYEAFCGAAGARYSRLRESIRLYSQSLDVPFEEKNFPSDLVGRALDEDCTRDPATIQKLITDFIIAEQKAGNIEGFVSEGEARMATVMKANARIAELSQQPSVSNMIEIAKLAESSRAEILRHQDWFTSEAGKMLGYVQCWQTFYAQVDALRPAEAPQAKPAKSPARGNDPQLQASLRAAQSGQQAAEQRAGELAEQLREANIELHRLRSAASAQPRICAPQPADTGNQGRHAQQPLAGRRAELLRSHRPGAGGGAGRRVRLGRRLQEQLPRHRPDARPDGQAGLQLPGCDQQRHARHPGAGGVRPQGLQREGIPPDPDRSAHALPAGVPLRGREAGIRATPQDRQRHRPQWHASLLRHHRQARGHCLRWASSGRSE